MIPIRLWHYKLFPYLPNKQIVSQWRELCLIFNKGNRFIIINYVYEYPKEDLYKYTLLLLDELNKRKINIKQWKYFNNYFNDLLYNNIKMDSNIFINHQTPRYLFQCFVNLQEKYERGQKDFSKHLYENLCEFIYDEYLKNIKIKDLLN